MSEDGLLLLVIALIVYGLLLFVSLWAMRRFVCGRGPSLRVSMGTSSEPHVSGTYSFTCSNCGPVKASWPPALVPTPEGKIEVLCKKCADEARARSVSTGPGEETNS